MIEHGQVGGQLMIARRLSEAKNVGKANATTPETQAIAEAKAEWQHKLDRKYFDSIEKVNQRKIDVMLAPNDKWIDTINPRNSTQKYVQYPADIQPKLDGARCLAYWEGDRVVLMTRGRKEWNLPHIKEQLAKVMPYDSMWDGELYFHGVKRQTIQKWITKAYPEQKKIEFHVYDVPMSEGEEKPQAERLADLDKQVPGTPMVADSNTPNIVKVLTLEVVSHEQVAAFNTQCVASGYEGCMVRNRKGLYEPGKRSRNLLKVKTFEDAEFKVVGFLEAEGGHTGCVIWLCSTDPNAEIIGFVKDKPKSTTLFKVVPNGSLPDRQEWLKEAHNGEYMGQQLTVKYQGFSEDGLPQIAKGIAFRLPEDMSVAAVSGKRKGKSGDWDDE